MASSIDAAGRLENDLIPAADGPRQVAIESRPWTSWPEVSPAWDTLAAVSPYTSFSLTSEWVGSWLEVFGPALQPEILVFRDRSARAVGACLLTFRTERRGPFRVRQAHLNTSGEDESEETCPEHNSVLCHADWEAPVAAALWRHLEGRGWDEFVASGMSEGVTLDSLLGSAPGALTVVRQDSVDPFVDLRAVADTKDAYLNLLSRNTREQVRRSMRLFAGAGPLKVVPAVGASEASAAFEELVVLHSEWWRARGQPGAFSSRRFRDFHRLLIERALPRDHIQLLRIWAGDQVLGVLYNFVLGGRVCYYQSGLRSGTQNRLKPGLVAHACAVEHCRRAGLLEYDFLAGQSRYKKSLATHSRRLVWLVFRRPGMKLAVIEAFRGIKSRLLGIDGATRETQGVRRGWGPGPQ